MTRRTTRWLAVLVLAVGGKTVAAPVPAGGDATAFKPTVTVRLAPLDKVLGDIRFTAERIARFAPSEKEAKEFLTATDEFIDKSLGPDWRKAIDTARPLFAYATLDANVTASTWAMLIPVKDAAAFRSMLVALAAKIEDGPDGVLRFQFPGERDAAGNPVSGYLRFVHQYAYVTRKNPATLALNRIPAPAQIAAGSPAAGISARLYLNRMPDVFRQQAIIGVEQFKRMMTGQGGGDGMRMSVAWMQMLFFGGPMLQLYPLAEPAVRDAQELAVEVGFDRTRLNLSFDLVVTPKAGSELSRLSAALKPGTSLFAQMVGPNLAARGLVRGTIPQDIRKFVGVQIEAGLGQAAQAEPVWGAFTAKIGESLLPTLREGEIDLAVGLLGPTQGQKYGIVAGLRLKDAAGIEKAFRDAVKALPKEAQAMFKLDTAKIKGVSIHQILPPPLPEPAKSIFGESTVHVAFRPDGVVAAFGDGAPGTLDSGLAAKPQPIAQSFIEVSGRKLIPLVTKIDAGVGKKLAAFLGTDLDRIPILELAVEGGASLRVRYGNGLATMIPAVGLFMFRAVGGPQPVQAAPAAPVRSE